MEVGTQIKILRENKNISREQMADWLSIGINTYKKIEYGIRIPALDELKIIVEKLDVNPSIFFEKGGTAAINNSNYATSLSNIVVNDKDLIRALNHTLARLTNVLDRLSEQ